MTANDLKWCTACKARHDRAEFGRDRSRGDGLSASCRASKHVVRKTPIERFQEKTRRDPSGCLIWTGATDRKGYGSLWFEGRVQGTHRVAWMLAEGFLPRDACVLHRCDVPSCVERNHLFLGDRADNAADMTSKGRRASQPGESNGRAKLNWSQVHEIRRSAAVESQRALARRFGVSKNLIAKIVNHELWVEGPHHFPGVSQRLRDREFPCLPERAIA